jgi:hypothetical protein
VLANSNQNESLQSDMHPMKRFKFLSEDLHTRITATSSSPSSDTTAAVEMDIRSYTDYISKLTDIKNECGLSFWNSNHNLFTSLTELAEDLLSAPASQAYSERVFSLCGALTALQRNRGSVMLKHRAFLKMNKNYYKIRS